VQENNTCLANYGRTPAEVLEGAGALGPAAVAVHATHVSARDIDRLSASGTGVCMCPTTEQDLADGIGPARGLAALGTTISLGSDSHAVIDIFQEMRALEMDERLASGQRGNWQAGELAATATENGHSAIAWPLAGRLAPGYHADLVSIDLGTVRLAGADASDLLPSAIFSASAVDIVHVVSSGRVVVADGQHQLVEDVGGELRSAIKEVCN
jgi:cytosine/adenosine deaminase-related metal-dependent hydrolase